MPDEHQHEATEHSQTQQQPKPDHSILSEVDIEEELSTEARWTIVSRHSIAGSRGSSDQLVQHSLLYVSSCFGATWQSLYDARIDVVFDSQRTHRRDRTNRGTGSTCCIGWRVTLNFES